MPGDELNKYDCGGNDHSNVLIRLFQDVLVSLAFGLKVNLLIIYIDFFSSLKFKKLSGIPLVEIIVCTTLLI